jgi:hypothetical protein
MDPGTFRTELRLRHTVAALLDQEEAREAARGDAGPRRTREELEAALLDRLRAKARIQLFL